MAAPRTVGVRVGDITQTTAKAVLVAFANTAATLTVNGVTYNASWSAVGTDNGPTPACYVATISITGLSAFTQYTWTVAQGVYTNTGTFYSAPRKTDNFSLFFYGCFNNPFNEINASVGVMDYIRDYQQNGELPLVAILPNDDILYIEVTKLANSTHNSTGNPSTTMLEYDYALAWCMWYGLAANCLGFMSGDHVDALENSAVLPMWGDHEFQDDLMAYDAATPNSYHATAGGFDGVALTAYNAMVKPLQGTALSIKDADTTSNHWGIDLGPLRYIASDGITKAIEGAGSRRWFGDEQIDDILNAMDDPTHPLKLLAVFPPTRKINGFYNKTSNIGGTLYSTAMDQYNVAEYKRLFLNKGQSPRSLCDSPYCNGDFGTFAVLKGDDHNGPWAYYHKDADTDAIVDESYLSACCNPARNGFHTNTTPRTLIGNTYDDADIVWCDSTVSRCAGIRIDVMGSENKMRLVQIFNMHNSTSPTYIGSFTTFDWQEVASRWLAPTNGNVPIETEADIVQPKTARGRAHRF